MSQQTVLVTGAAGFIGSHTVDRLLELGHRVIGVDNFCDYYRVDFKEYNVSHLTEAEKAGQFKMVRADIRDAEAMEAIFKNEGIDVLIHLAAQAGVRVSIDDPVVAADVNVVATYLLFDLARRYNVEEVIYASSSSVYGNQEKTPFSETDNVDYPISPYAATKKACELIAYTYHHLFGTNMIGLRFFTVYGERGRPDMSPYIFANAIVNEQPLTRFGDGSMKRDFTYVGDIVEGIVKGIGVKPGYEVINLGNSECVTLNEYIETFERVIGKKANIVQEEEKPGDVFQTFADTQRAKDVLGWEPTTDLESGLKKFVDWFESVRKDDAY